MKKLIHYALNQPLFIVLGTLLFVMSGVIAVSYTHLTLPTKRIV